MIHLKNPAELRDWTRKSQAHPRVFVPTMGALHEGHLSLCDIAREHAGRDGSVIASIFVNPAQFGPSEDLDKYPRELDADLAKCESRGVDVVFAPDREAESKMYAPDASVSVVENSLSNGLCGASRPVHFGGVCTVVAKLFNLVQPDAAVFGEKDFQQLAIIRRMVRDLNFPVQIVGGPTIREPNGLAMSSRNKLLTEEERAAAPVIRRALVEAAETIQQGSFDEPTLLIRNRIIDQISAEPTATIDYVGVVDADSLEPIERFDPARPWRIAVAVNFSKTRLIDNIGPDHSK